MSKFLNGILILSIAFLAACGGGGGITAPGDHHPGISDQQYADKANAFIAKKSAELGVQVTIAKLNTDQKGQFIVVFNPSTNEYRAYDLNSTSSEMKVLGLEDDGWASDDHNITMKNGGLVNKDGDNFYYHTSVQTGYLIQVTPGHYKNETVGVTVRFEEVSGQTKDLESAFAAKQDELIDMTSQNIQASFGLSEERSYDVAKLVYNMQLNQSKSMTKAELNSFSKELLNISFDELKSAAINPNSNQTESLIERAAIANNISNEHMKAILQGFFQ